MKADRLKKLRALADAATCAPWHVRTRDDIVFVDAIPGEAGICELPFDSVMDQRAEAEADGKFIAAARTAIPELLDEVERLRRMLREALYAADAGANAALCLEAWLDSDGTITADSAGWRAVEKRLRTLRNSINAALEDS